MAGSSSAARGNALFNHFIYLRLLEERDGWVDSEKSKEPGEAVVYVHRVLPVVVGVSADDGGCEE